MALARLRTSAGLKNISPRIPSPRTIGLIFPALTQRVRVLLSMPRSWAASTDLVNVCLLGISKSWCTSKPFANPKCGVSQNLLTFFIERGLRDGTTLCKYVVMSMEAAPDMRLEFDQADRLRRALRVSNVSVSDMADYLGVTRNTVSNWINGHTPPKSRDLRLFAMRTGVPYEWLESGISEDPRNGPGRGPSLGNATIQYHNSPVIMRPVVDLSTLRDAS